MSSLAKRRFTREELEAARVKTLNDVIADDLDVLFCGINPGLRSAASGHHFANPANRFWPALHRSGFTPRLLTPDEQGELPTLGLGITNIAHRTTARADELTKAELVEGAKALREKVIARRPGHLAVLGVTAYRTAFGMKDAVIGPQDHPIGDTHVWVLPNPSGLNAHYTPAMLADEFERLRISSALRHQGSAMVDIA
jgi:TDG/mug DNA glycosylase family protein